jgi:hypothetical protein
MILLCNHKRMAYEKPYAYLEPMCYSRKFASGAESLILQSLQFQYVTFCCKFPGRVSINHYGSNQGFVENQFNVSRNGLISSTQNK